MHTYGWYGCFLKYSEVSGLLEPMPLCQFPSYNWDNFATLIIITWRRKTQKGSPMLELVGSLLQLLHDKEVYATCPACGLLFHLRKTMDIFGLVLLVTATMVNLDRLIFCPSCAVLFVERYMTIPMCPLTTLWAQCFESNLCLVRRFI